MELYHTMSLHRVILFEFPDEYPVLKTKMMGLSDIEDCVILTGFI